MKIVHVPAISWITQRVNNPVHNLESHPIGSCSISHMMNQVVWGSVGQVGEMEIQGSLRDLQSGIWIPSVLDVDS